MKTIGLLGGMSWESTQIYYREINEVIAKKLNGLHSASILLYSFDFAIIEKLQALGDWDASGKLLAEKAKLLEGAGADFIVICTNTMHKVADQVEDAITIPLLHITDPMIRALQHDNIKQVALLGTKYTMTQDFYKDKLSQAGIRVIVPDEEEIEIINAIIYNELCLGVIREDSHKVLVKIISKLTEKGAQALILGCTELGLIIRDQSSSLRIFDTTLLHAQFAAKYALKEDF